MKVMVLLSLIVASTLLTCCGGSISHSNTGSVDLVFVVSEDVAYHTPGDVDASTANLTPQGLQRAVRMGSFLKQNVLGANNVTRIYALEPMTHLQTADNYPDMTALETIQQFAMLNQISLPSGSTSAVLGNSFPLYASYSPVSVPKSGVATPVVPCPICQGIDFNDVDSGNEILVDGIIGQRFRGITSSRRHGKR